MPSKQRFAKRVVIFDGPIGVGKSTLAKAVARQMGAGFIEGDDFCAPDKPWFACNLSTSRRIVDASLKRLCDHDLVLIARPLRCRDWVFFAKHFEKAHVVFHSIGLIADPADITGDRRARALSQGEQDRSVQMIAQGYGTRPFHLFVQRTDQHCMTRCALDLAKRLRSFDSQSNAF